MKRKPQRRRHQQQSTGRKPVRKVQRSSSGAVVPLRGRRKVTWRRKDRSARNVSAKHERRYKGEDRAAGRRANQSRGARRGDTGGLAAKRARRDRKGRFR